MENLLRDLPIQKDSLNFQMFGRTTEWLVD